MRTVPSVTTSTVLSSQRFHLFVNDAMNLTPASAGSAATCNARHGGCGSLRPLPASRAVCMRCHHPLGTRYVTSVRAAGRLRIQGCETSSSDLGQKRCRGDAGPGGQTVAVTCVGQSWLQRRRILSDDTVGGDRSILYNSVVFRLDWMMCFDFML
jgi:hypothetical protein